MFIPVKWRFFCCWLAVEVCIPELVLNETRLELISRIGGTGTRLMFSGLVTRENFGKIREKTGRDRLLNTVREIPQQYQISGPIPSNFPSVTCITVFYIFLLGSCPCNLGVFAGRWNEPCHQDRGRPLLDLGMRQSCRGSHDVTKLEGCSGNTTTHKKTHTFLCGPPLVRRYFLTTLFGLYFSHDI